MKKFCKALLRWASWNGGRVLWARNENRLPTTLRDHLMPLRPEDEIDFDTISF